MSLLMVRKVAPAHAADASEIQRVEKLLKRKLTDAEFWKLGDYVMKNLKAGKSFTDAELLKAVKDCAAGAQDADIREPKVGDVLKYYHPRTGKYVGKVKVVNIHRHSDAKWDAQFECEYLDGELKGGRFRDEGGENISFT